MRFIIIALIIAMLIALVCITRSTLCTNPVDDYSVLLVSTGLLRAKACPSLQAAFERLRKGDKVAYDITAFVYDTVRDKALSIEEYNNRRKLGRERAAALEEDYDISCTVVDLSETSFDRDAYLALVADADVYFIDGGNTWALQHWWRVRGAHDTVAKRVRTGKMLYVGSSAGGIICGKSIEMAKWKGWDEPEAWQASYACKTDWTDCTTLAGMNLVGGMSFFPHYASSLSALYIENAAKTDHVVLFGANGHGIEATMQAGRLSVSLLSPENIAWDEPYP